MFQVEVLHEVLGKDEYSTTLKTAEVQVGVVMYPVPRDYRFPDGEQMYVVQVFRDAVQDGPTKEFRSEAARQFAVDAFYRTVGYQLTQLEAK